MMRNAFRALGNNFTSPGAVEVGGTHRYVGCMAVTASMFKCVQDEALSRYRQHVEASKVRSVLLCLHHDATPVTVAFGALHEDLWQHARYLQHDGEKLHLLSFEKYKQLSKRAAPQRGVVELFAQTKDLHYKMDGSFQHLELKVMHQQQHQQSAAAAAAATASKQQGNAMLPAELDWF